MEAFFAILVLLLALIGLAFLIRFLNLWLVNPRLSGPRVLVVSLSGGHPEPEVRGILEFYRLIGSRFFQRICLVDFGLTEEAAEACKIICRENHCFSFCSPSQMQEVFNQEGAIPHGQFNRNDYYTG